MENPHDRNDRSFSDIEDWTKAETEELILFYLEDYYKTLDENLLQEALQLAKDGGINIEIIMQRARSKMA